MVSIRVVLCIVISFFNVSIFCMENKKIRRLQHNIFKRHSGNYISNAYVTYTNSTKKLNINKALNKHQMINMFFKKAEALQYINTFKNKSFSTGNSLMIFTKKPDGSKPDIFLMQHLKSTTPSNIEFYYLEDRDIGQKISKFKEINKSLSNLIHVNNTASTLQQQVSETSPVKSVMERSIYKHILPLTTEIKFNKTSTPIKKDSLSTSSETTHDKLDNNITTNPLTKTIDEVTISGKKTNNTVTPAYDRVKFFDIYDSDTSSYFPSSAITNKKRYGDDKEKVILQEITQNNDTHFNSSTAFSRFVKKHIDDKKFGKSSNKNQTNDDFFLSRFIGAPKVPTSQSSENKRLNTSHAVNWSDFPFVAAYFYEPSKVRCDAAAISAHWLLSSAACLSKHHKDPKSGDRSAYVVYCSENWRRPVRISYVQRSIIHPRFHLKDKVRRHLYNVGAIQILNSMPSTCNGWSPVSLISHQVFGGNDGTNAIVVGWGLDRYDAVYLNQNNSKGTLAFYQNIIYSKSCLGNFGYNKLRERDVDVVSNTYCVSLPSYSNADIGTIRGGLLLMGGRLVALYLQEKCKSSGEQTALYTGIWKQIRWIFDVSSEPEDPDIFMFDM